MREAEKGGRGGNALALEPDLGAFNPNNPSCDISCGVCACAGEKRPAKQG